jgi:pilus assembly protein CpaE
VADYHDLDQVIDVTGTMTIGITGTRDQQLEEMVQACGLRPTHLKLDDLTTLAQPGSAQPAVVLMDLRERPMLPPAVATLRRVHPTTGIVVVAAALEPALMLEAMRAGVTEFVTAPLTASELQAALGRVMASSSPMAAGQVFAFLGAKGGVGTTTIGVNVATALAQLNPGSTLLIDLHLAYGDAAIYLGTEPRFSVVDALDNVHRLDRAFLRGLVGRSAGGLDFLGSSDRASARPVDPVTVRALIEAVANHYRYVVLDVPRSDDVMLDVLEPATRIVIVANQELATVRAAARVAATLRQRYGKGRVSVVVSRFDKLASIGEDDVERALGGRVAQTFPSNYRLALDALNAGRPVVLDNHNQLAAALTKFARRLAEVSDEPAPEGRSSGLLGRLTGKRR